MMRQRGNNEKHQKIHKILKYALLYLPVSRLDHRAVYSSLNFHFNKNPFTSDIFTGSYFLYLATLPEKAGTASNDHMMLPLKYAIR